MNFDTLKYATEAEATEIAAAFKEIEALDIKYNFKLDRNLRSFDKLIDHNDFEQWLIRFLNKLNDLRFAYIQVALSINKGIPDDKWKREKEEGGTIFFEEFTKEEHSANKFLFDFFIEIFYYHYFSSIDLFHKILDKLYSLKIEGDPVKFNEKVLKGIKLKNKYLSTAIKEFLESIKYNRTIRNGFTHNYAANEIDLRSKQHFKDGKRRVVLMDPSYTTSKELFRQSQELIKLYIPVLKSIEIGIQEEDLKYLVKPKD